MGREKRGARPRTLSDEVVAAIAELTDSQSAPEANAVLALGQVLFSARLDHFISHAFTPVTNPAALTRNLLSAAADYHNPVATRSAESNAIAVRRALQGIASQGLWLHIRDELAKFARRAAEELAAREPVRHDRGGTGPKTAPKTRRTRNRTPTPLPAGQRAAYELVGRHNGNVAKAAEEAGVSRQALNKRYKKACKKIGEATGRKSKPRTQRLPTDSRGQANVARRADPDEAE